MKNAVKNEDVIFISPSGESPQEEEYTKADIQKDNPSSRITSVLSRLEVVRRRNILADSSLLDNKDRSSINDYTSISQVYEPLNKLLAMLLPHLKFEKGNISNTDSPKCIFSKNIFSKDTPNSISHSPNQVDIDKLTRVEVEVISQFLPLVEYQILRKLAPQSDVNSFADVVVLMDMPDLLLPSQLQSLLLEYIRSVVREEENGNIQFIVVTSSPALIDKATSEERFMLMPSSEHLIEGSNQLVKVSDTNMFLTH